MPNEPTAWEASSNPLDWKRTPSKRLLSFGDDVLTKRSTLGEIIQYGNVQ